MEHYKLLRCLLPSNSFSSPCCGDSSRFHQYSAVISLLLNLSKNPTETITVDVIPSCEPPLHTILGGDCANEVHCLLSYLVRCNSSVLIFTLYVCVYRFLYVNAHSCTYTIRRPWLIAHLIRAWARKNKKFSLLAVRFLLTSNIFIFFFLMCLLLNSLPNLCLFKFEFGNKLTVAAMR